MAARHVLLAALVAMLGVLGAPQHAPARPADVTRIAFGSCNKHFKPQPMWQIVRDRQPDAWVFLGDMVYADTPVFFKWRIPASIEQIRASYDTMRHQADYQALLADVRARQGAFFVWDDHEYGQNDGDKNFAIREASKQEMLAFVEEPADSPRWQPGRALHAVYRLAGPDGRTLRLILLDNRYDRDPNPSWWQLYRSSHPQDILGSEQFAWLADELRAHSADLTLIGAGLQFLSDDKWIGEGWDQFPASQAKILALLADTNTTAVFLSGDVHLAEATHLTCPALGRRRILDFTSSGLTHSWGGLLRSTLINLAVPGTRRIPGAIYHDRNVGELDIHWAAADQPLADTTLRFRVFGADNTSHFEVGPIRLADLAPVADTDRAAVAACAAANLSAPGLPEACAKVLEDCTPSTTLAIGLQILAGYVVAASLFFAVVGLLLGTPLLIFRSALSRPAKTILLVAFVAAIAILVELVK